MLHNLAISNTVYFYRCYHYLFPRRSHSHELASVCAPNAHARNYLVLFSNHVFNGNVNVWKGVAIHGYHLFDTLGARRQFWWGVVVYCVFSAELIYYIEIAPVHHFLDEAPNDCFVFFR